MVRVEFGGVTQVQQTLREQAGFPWLESTVRDIGDAFRCFQRNRGFFAAVVVILALGIGATTAVFSVAETLLLRPLSYPASDRLVTVRSVDLMSDYPSTRVPPGVLADWQIKATSFDGIAGYRWATADVIDGAQSDRLYGLLVTPEFFDVFGVPLLGRSFHAEDRGAKRLFESTDTGETLVLGNEVWRRRFDADDALVGSTVDLHVLNFSRVGPTRYTVLGVATAPVRFPPLQADFQIGDSSVIDTIDFWMPQFVSATQLGQPGPRDSWFDVVARLRPGVTLEQAQAEMDGIARLQAEQQPETNRGREIRVVSLRQYMAGESRNGILLLWIGTSMLLLIACSNVATLALARGVARRREVAIRTALGAPRCRIVRQFLMEAVILAACAGLVGVLLAAWTINVARPWMPPQSLPLLQEMRINLTVLVFALTSVVFTACITGLAPAFRSARAEGARLTRLDGRGATLSRSHSRLVGVLVSAEVALTVVLLVGAGLLVRSAFRASQVETGFNPGNLLTMTISLPANKFDWDHNARFAREVIEAVRSLSSISDAAVVHGVTMRASSYVSNGQVTIEGYVPANDNEEPTYSIRVVSPSYFATMQIPIVAGRSFEARDEEGKRGAPRTILVSNSFAKRYWQGQDPLGKRISGKGRSDWKMTVVGVAGDVRYSGLERGPTIDLYLPQGLFPQAAITLIARTRGDPRSEVPAVRERIRAVDPHAFVTDIRSMEQLVAGPQAERRAGTLLVSAFGEMALVLVVAGVYSVITQAVVRREPELAIRSALGAGPGRVVALAMRTALEPAAVGIALGALAALAVTRVMTSLLFEVSALDIVTWVGASATLLAACMGAGYLPGRRAARIDPVAALRSE